MPTPVSCFKPAPDPNPDTCDLVSSSHFATRDLMHRRQAEREAALQQQRRNDQARREAADEAAMKAAALKARRQAQTARIQVRSWWLRSSRLQITIIIWLALGRPASGYNMLLQALESGALGAFV